jgi:prepilin-type processing-associated H-X9-DG protein
VVIAIIAILASMLLPALNKARDRAKSISCVSNLKTLSSYWSMYCMDHDGHLLSYAGNAQRWIANGADANQHITWAHMMRDYLNISSYVTEPYSKFQLWPANYRNKASIILCPAYSDGVLRGRVKYLMEAHYGMPRYNIGGDNYGSRTAFGKVHDMKLPTKQICWTDIATSISDTGYGGWSRADNYDGGDGTRKFTETVAGRVDPRHSERYNNIFGDGHVEAMSIPEGTIPYPLWLKVMPWGWNK